MLGNLSIQAKPALKEEKGRKMGNATKTFKYAFGLHSVLMTTLDQPKMSYH